MVDVRRNTVRTRIWVFLVPAVVGGLLASTEQASAHWEM